MIETRVNDGANHVALVIDDTPMNRQLFGFALGSISNVQVHELDSLELGIEAMASLRPDIVFAHAAVGLIERLRASGEFVVRDSAELLRSFGPGAGSAGPLFCSACWVSRIDGSGRTTRVLEYELRT